MDVRLTGFAVLGMWNWVVRRYHAEGPHTPEEIASNLADVAVFGLTAGRLDSPRRGSPRAGALLLPSPQARRSPHRRHPRGGRSFATFALPGDPRKS
jgi:hypothetical protein